MRLVSLKLLEDNINNHFDIQQETQDKFRVGLAQYIVDLGKSLQLPPDIVSMAIMYTQVFFLKKCYINYDKEVIGCAALYLSSKNEYFKRKLSDFMLNFQRTKLSGQLFKPMTDQQKNELTEEICVAECLILKTVGFQLDLQTPYLCLNEFQEALYSKELYPMQYSNIWKVSLAVCNDSFYTQCNIVFSGPSVALACILFAAVRFQAPLPYSEEGSLGEQSGESFDFQHVYKKLYLPKHSSNQDPMKEFLQTPWFKRIHDEIELEEVEGTLIMIEEFYSRIETFEK